MKIKFLGTSNSFVIPEKDNNFNSNILIELNNKKLLIDAGITIQSALFKNDIKIEEIDAIYITHCHSDHIGGLEYIGNYFKYILNKKIDLIANISVMNQLKNILNYSFDNNISDYFNIVEVKYKHIFKIENIEFLPIQILHEFNDEGEKPSFGLRFTFDDTKIIFTGDCRFDFWRMIGLYEWADIIFHDCEFKEYDNSIHSQYRDLKKLPNLYKQKILLYHYDNNIDIESYNLKVKKDGFKGLVKPFEIFDFSKEN